MQTCLIDAKEWNETNNRMNERTQRNEANELKSETN